MAGSTLTAQTLEKDTDESWVGAVILSRWLDQSGVDLAISAVGTPTKLEGPDNLLTISDVSVNTENYTSRKKGTVHPAGEVLFYTVAGGTRKRQYKMKIPFTVTDGENSQTWVVILSFEII